MNIESFEKSVFEGDIQRATQLLLEIIQVLESSKFQPDCTNLELTKTLCTRVSSAIIALVCNNNFKIDDTLFATLLQFKCRIIPLFIMSDYQGTSVITNRYKSKKITDRNFENNEFRKYFSFLPFEEVSLNLVSKMAKKSPELFLRYMVGLLSDTAFLTESKEKRRSQVITLVKSMPVVNISQHEISWIATAWMNISYSLSPARHDVKSYLNRVISNWIATNMRSVEPTLSNYNKPVMILAIEKMNSKHAMFRCYWESILSLKTYFHIILLADGNAVDDAVVKLADEVLLFNAVKDDLALILAKAKSLSADIIYFPSIGMHYWTLLLANSRIAPIQVLGLGHPATTNSPYMDYTVTEEGNFSDINCFSEKVVMVRNGGLPYMMRADAKYTAPKINESPSVLHIAISAAEMKLNYQLLSVCQSLIDESPQKIEFHFFTNGSDIGFFYFKENLQKALSGVVHVYSEMDYNDYIVLLTQCDILLSPFPFGGTNSNIDSARQALPVVNMDGGEVFSHVDHEIMSRLGQPDWLTAYSLSEYKSSALRLINNSTERVEISKKLCEVDTVKALNLSAKAELGKCLHYIYLNNDYIKSKKKHAWHIAELETLSVS